jgi:hypothetical protein
MKIRLRSNKPRKIDVPVCVVRLDRIELIAEPKQHGRNVPPVTDYRCLKDHFVPSQTSIPTYKRCRRLQHNDSGMKVFWQYQPECGFLREWKFSCCPNDKRGFRIADVIPILKQCRTYRLISVELSLDFPAGSFVDDGFIKRHARFGKSHRQFDRGGPDQLRYGTRKSSKLVRCYVKPPVSSYRVELELHSGFLRKHRIASFLDLEKLVTSICPNHLLFVQIRWERLRQYLVQKFGDRRGGAIFQAARERSRSLLLVFFTISHAKRRC